MNKNVRPLSDFKFDFPIKDVLLKVMPKPLILLLKDDDQKFITNMVQKKEKCALGSSFLCGTSTFDLMVLSKLSSGVLKTRFKIFFKLCIDINDMEHRVRFLDNSHILKQAEIITSSEAVAVLAIYSSWYLELKNEEAFSILLICVFVMSHLQATVQGAFSYNEPLVQTSILPDNVSEKLIVKENLRCNGGRLIPQS